MLTSKIKINEVQSKLPTSFAFVCFSSYERRCTTIVKTLNPKSVETAYIFYNKNLESNKEVQNHTAEISTFLLGNSNNIPLDLKNPMSVSEKITYCFKKIIVNKKRVLVLDITAFTHEALLMVLRLLYTNIEHFDSIQCLYNGASSYSGFNENTDPQLVWLSKGCNDVRSVIGYPGLLDPTAKNILVLLTGFEFERATKLIDILNPDYVILGKGDRKAPTDKNHIRIMDHMSNKFETWSSSNKKLVIKSFTFSCSDVERSRDDLLGQISDDQDKNYIIVPINTKISTVAVAIVAFLNPSIQICYALPEVYNIENYSEPSENVTIIELSRILAKIPDSKEIN